MSYCTSYKQKGSAIRHVFGWNSDPLSNQNTGRRSRTPKAKPNTLLPSFIKLCVANMRVEEGLNPKWKGWKLGKDDRSPDLGHSPFGQSRCTALRGSWPEMARKLLAVIQFRPRGAWGSLDSCRFTQSEAWCEENLLSQRFGKRSRNPESKARNAMIIRHQQSTAIWIQEGVAILGLAPTDGRCSFI